MQVVIRRTDVETTEPLEKILTFEATTTEWLQQPSALYPRDVRLMLAIQDLVKRYNGGE